MMVVALMVLTELLTHADAMAEEAGIDPLIFRNQINMESGWDPQAVSWAGAQGIAQIIPEYHPDMEGKTFDPYMSLEYAANLMSSHLAYREGDYREALADYNTGRNSSGSFRDQGYSYADRILEASGQRQPTELELITGLRSGHCIIWATRLRYSIVSRRGSSIARTIRSLIKKPKFITTTQKNSPVL